MLSINNFKFLASGVCGDTIYFDSISSWFLLILLSSFNRRNTKPSCLLTFSTSCILCFASHFCFLELSSHIYGGIPVLKLLHTFNHLFLGFLLSFLSPLSVQPTSAQPVPSPEGEESFKKILEEARSISLCTKCWWLISISLFPPLQKNLTIFIILQTPFLGVYFWFIKTTETSLLVLDTAMLKSFWGFCPHTWPWGLS